MNVNVFGRPIGRTSVLCSVLLIGTVLTGAVTGTPAEAGRQPDAAVTQIKPHQRIVQFQQVNFVLEVARILRSDWGQVQVDQSALKSETGHHSGYLNVFLRGAGRTGRTAWAVGNMFVPAPDTPRHGRMGRYKDAPWGHRVIGPPRAHPKPSRYLDLRPGEDNGHGRVRWLPAIVLFSVQPLPVTPEIVSLAEGFSSHRFKVNQIKENAEGDLGDDAPTTTPPIGPVDLSAPIGQPPQPLSPSSGVPLDLAFPIGVFQSALSNVQSASNQCVPVAHANNLQFLEDEYDGLPLVWRLPHQPTRGLGRAGLAGDIPFWEPITPNSLVANVDTFTRRIGTFNRSSGNGSSRCQNIRGIFGYLAAHGDQAHVLFRHQGGEVEYGDGTECDDLTAIDLGGIVTTREGLNPTWEWIFEQLSLGRGVVMSFQRYDINGNRDSGHMVRVWGASRIGATKYLHTLDDGIQSNDSNKTRTQDWEVKDIGGPGQPGIPDGRLNMNGMSWEIGFAMSAEAKPTLVLP